MHFTGLIVGLRDLEKPECQDRRAQLQASESESRKVAGEAAWTFNKADWPYSPHTIGTPGLQLGSIGKPRQQYGVQHNGSEQMMTETSLHTMPPAVLQQKQFNTTRTSTTHVRQGAALGTSTLHEVRQHGRACFAANKAVPQLYSISLEGR